MDYRKIILYLIIIIVAVGVWHRYKQNDRRQADAAERFASVYAATSVLAELYRTEPERFFRARDSVYQVYNFNVDSIEAFKQSFKDREEGWEPIWSDVRHKTDSLVEYFKANPIEHPAPDSGKTTGDTAVSH